MFSLSCAETHTYIYIHIHKNMTATKGLFGERMSEGERETGKEDDGDEERMPRGCVYL
jgi:hypothetical protein